MEKEIDRLKKKLKGEVFSLSELENCMSEFEFVLVETESETEANLNAIRFTNHKSQIWIEVETDNENSVLIIDVKRVTKINNEPTRVEPFRTYGDLEKVLFYFKENKMYHHWLTASLMVSLGRRVGDTLSLKWSDFFYKNGEYKERLNTLKEEKTGKILGVRINALAKTYIEEYKLLLNVDLCEYYMENIFTSTGGAFRKALKQAVQEVGIKYRISTHSFRKFYANTLYKLHPQDSDNLMIVQSILGHSDSITTKIYINEIDRKIDKYNEDYANHMINKINGIDTEISNSPVISLKSEDLRNIMSLCWDAGSKMKDKYESLNNLIKLAEECMV